MTDRPDAWLDEPAAPQSPVPVTPVRTRNRLRLGAVIGLLTLALVATAVVAGGRLLQTTASSTGLAVWAPADTVFYVESRFAGLPVEQRTNLQAFLERFPIPGTGDLEVRIADAFDRLIGGISDGSHDYSTEIKPWVTGAVAGAAVDLPTMGPTGGSSEMGTAILILGITDRAAATTWIDEVVADSGPNWERSTHGGASLLSVGRYSITALDDVLLLGETGLVQGTIDRGGARGLAADTSFAAAAGSISSEHLLAWYVDGSRYVDWIRSIGETRSPIGACTSAFADVPGWIAGTLAADEGALLAQGSWPHVEAIAPASKNGPSTLLSRLPASSLVVADVHELGAAVKRAVDRLRDCDDAGTGMLFDQIDSAIGAVGGWDGITGALGETAFVLDRGANGPVGGVAVVPSDPAAARRLIDQASALIGLAGDDVALTEESYAGETLTVISSTEPGDDAINVAWVVTDTLVAIGEESWVKAVLDTSSGESLASDGRFSAALARVDAEHASLLYLNVSGASDWIRDQAGDAVAFGSEHALESLGQIGALIATTTTSNDTDAFHAAITLK